MFPMLDYRAHKLYWLLWRPFWLFNIALNFVMLFPAHSAGKYFFDNVIAVFFVALIFGYIVFGVLFNFLFKAITWSFDHVFRFFVDVVPARGRNSKEAWAVVEEGESVMLNLKLSDNILEWTQSDTEEAFRTQSWGIRSFFSTIYRARLSAILNEAQKRKAAGERITGFSLSEYNSIIESEGLTPRWPELFFRDNVHLWTAVQTLALLWICIADVGS